MKFNLSDGNSLYYEYHVTNDKNAKTIILLNGLTQTTASWGGVVPHLLQNGFHVLLVDFVFQGQSSQKGEFKNFEQHAHDVHSLIHELKLDSCIVAGISYGSLVAQRFAVLFPNHTHKLILMSTFAHKTPYFEAIELSWNHTLEIGGYNLLVEVMLPSVLGKLYFDNPLIPIEQLKELRNQNPPDKESLKKLMKATLELKDYRQQLKNIVSPTLVIHGGMDLLIPIEMGKAVADSIPNSIWVILPTKGHTLNLEAIDDINHWIVKFCR